MELRPPTQGFELTLLLLLLLLFISSRCVSGAQRPRKDVVTLEEEELITLLQIKNGWGNSPSLSNWNKAIHHCNWTGIECAADGSVAGISLVQQNLDSPIPGAVCKLRNLSRLNLSYNYIPGPFPTSLYSCSNLQYLDLSQNCFVGQVPVDISKLSPAITHLNLAFNNFTGDIPSSIARLPAIQFLLLNDNLFNGSFPLELGGLVVLITLALAHNPFLPARIPAEFGNLSKLKYLWMSRMNLEGEIPETMGNLTELEHLDLSMNKLSGAILSTIWTLEKLQFLYLYGNKFSGEIGSTIKALGLVEVDISINELTGAIPEDFGKLENLSLLCMYYNHLSGEIPSDIGFLRKLYDIRLFNNSITGVLPPELGRYSMLWRLELSNNKLVGGLPEHLCAGKALFSLSVFNNKLSGSIGSSLNHCRTLSYISLYNNMFSGDFPSEIWSAPNLTSVIIHHNLFSGVLPEELPRNLNRLEMNDNRFSGSIPLLASNLLVFKASNNFLSGSIPTNLSGLSKLQTLSLGGNRISGPIPSSISTLVFLVDLNFSNNILTGRIPWEIGSLNGLTSLDLSSNHLSGLIPQEMGNLKLNILNLSYNQLSGQIPIQLQNPVYWASFQSNPGLCSSQSISNLRPCTHQSQHLGKISEKLLILFVTLGGFLFIMTVAMGLWIYQRKDQSSSTPDDMTVIHFQKLEFSEFTIMGGLTEDNLIGSGGGGQVYRINTGSLNEEYVAVKRIWNKKERESTMEKQFDAEVKILGSIRHANVVTLLCCMSSANVKLLVYEYMEKGSLYQWLHQRRWMATGSGDAPIMLDWPRRFRIALDAAKGLSYMHHDLHMPIVHRDVKSSNILLDPEFGAKIADFGLARMLTGAGEPDEVSAMAGSFGYIAPECAKTKKIDEKVDVYSFGVVLLELVTGRVANDGGEHRSLVDWAWMHFQGEGRLMDALDEDLREDPSHFVVIEGVFMLGLVCTLYLPQSRPTMKEVLRRLRELNGTPELHDPHEKHLEAAPLILTKKGSRNKSSSLDCEGLCALDHRNNLIFFSDNYVHNNNQ